MRTKELSAELMVFIESVDWTYEKTMPGWPHEYIVRDRVDVEMFVRWVNHIRNYGYVGRLYSKPISYYDHDGMTYWTMGAQISETIIINRCRKEDTYERRLAEGRLPEG